MLRVVVAMIPQNLWDGAERVLFLRVKTSWRWLHMKWSSFLSMFLLRRFSGFWGSAHVHACVCMCVCVCVCVRAQAANILPPVTSFILASTLSTILNWVFSGVIKWKLYHPVCCCYQKQSLIYGLTLEMGSAGGLPSSAHSVKAALLGPEMNCLCNVSLQKAASQKPPKKTNSHVHAHTLP